MKAVPAGYWIFVFLFGIGAFAYVVSFPATIGGSIERGAFLISLFSSPVFWGIVGAILAAVLLWPSKRHHH